ncbi:MAG: hypothetical protein E6Q98_16165 [Rhodospirillaceae bacterium]|nr:MAG: hypothetical protein E6Q98_16165 [Rhodospirillaceae bacterium]
MLWLGTLLILSSLLCVAIPTQAGDQQIKQAIIEASIAAYPGRCACPYNHTANGRKCGARSARSKPGGRAPICYPDDVTPEMIERFKAAKTQAN